MPLTNQGATKLGATSFCDHPHICLTGPIPRLSMKTPWIDCLRCEANGPLPMTWLVQSAITARKNEPAD